MAARKQKTVVAKKKPGRKPRSKVSLSTAAKVRLRKQKLEEAPRPTTTNPLDVQVGGSHYKGFKIQPGEFSEANGLSFFEGSVIKRICRHSRGGKGLEDLEKSIHEIRLLAKLQYDVEL